MATEASNQGNAATTPSKSEGQKSPRQRRGRGGLGRGLGALIPDSEVVTPAEQGRPLDVLFPDLQSGNHGSGSGPVKTTRQRGGSARDLLTPRSAAGNVSRETTLSGTVPQVQNNETGNGWREDETSSGQGRGRNGGTARVATPEAADGTRDQSDAPGEAAPSGSVAETVGRRPQKMTGKVKVTAKKSTHVLSEERNESDVSRETKGMDLKEVPGATFGMIRPDWIIPNLKQPRHVFDSDELKELSQSISEVGVLQPIVLRRITDATLAEEGQSERLREALEEQPEARYEIIMGERRWRASQMAGLEEIPAIIRITEEDDLLRDALIENLHRVQLNPLEEAAAYSQLMEDFACTQEELSRRIARSRPQIANTLRLLRLPPSVQRQLAAGVLSAGHARALLSLESGTAMEALAARVVSEGLSVRATEEQVKFGKQGKPRPKRTSPTPSPEAQRVADAVADLLETSVSVNSGAKRGRLIIEFADQGDLERIAQALGAEVV
ncbi:ParB/RepB/Spo0J family partition protein [Actinomycetaceae bacterium MB13-C1-2]|nr:ParB/RepB/Spo0J family partition protein [Actinomycetaceae bacterium MB13-C1-2]